MGWTPRQQEAIDKRGTNLLVSAAAGSGKTSVLVERVRKLVMEEGVSIDSMLIVTFTNAAAAEMKERIYDALTKALADPNLDPKQKPYLRSQLSLIGRANISTFHKFALEIVHRYYHVIGIKPGLAICDDAKQEILKKEAMDEVMEAHYAEGGPEFKAFLDCFCNSRGDEPAREIIGKCNTFLNSNADPKGWIETISDTSLIESFREEYMNQQVQNRCRLALSYFEAARDYLADIPSLSVKNEADIEFCQYVLDAACNEGIEKVLEMLGGHKFNQMRTGKADKAAWEAVKTEVSGLRDCGKAHHDYIKKNLIGLMDKGTEKQREMLDNVLGTLISLTLEFSALYGEKKASQGLLDFSDAEHFAIEILKNEDVCKEYREKFKCIFVDEYQDSNAVQDTLIESVSTGDNVFRVGDVKQSIYKFRLAEPGLFLMRYDGYKEGSMVGEALDLNSNFRSKKEVIDLVNTIFKHIMTRNSCGMDYTDDAALVKGSSYGGPLSYKPKLYLIDTANAEDAEGQTETDEEIEDLKGAELEALKAVEIIRSYHGKPIHDDKKNKDRPLEYRDMAILLRATKSMGEVFYKTFTDAGIPVYMERNEGYFDAFEIQVFMNLLRIIDNTGRDIPLLSVLRAPVFGFCADELADVRIWAIGRGMRRTPYNKIFRLFAAEGPEGALKEKCSSFLEKLRKWQIQAQYTPLADFIWQLLSETGYSVFAAASPSGEQRLANLRALVDKAAKFESDNSGGLFGFINYIEALTSKDSKVQTGLASVLSENADVVRIMTIHHSKGLEFPFVMVSGLGKKFGGNNSDKVVFHKTYGMSAKLVNPRNNASYDPSSFNLIKAKIAEENLAEEIRVLYVALTRPKDIVVMTAAVSNPADLITKASVKIPEDVEGSLNFLSMMLPAIGDSADIEISSKYSLSASKKEAEIRMESLEKGLDDGFTVDESQLPISAEEIRRRLNYNYEPEVDLQEKRKYSVSQIAAMEKKVYRRPPRVLASEEDQEDKLDAAERGTAYHTVMEHIPFTPEGKTPEDIRLFMDGLVEKHILTEAQAKAVDPSKISAFFDSAIGREVLASKEIHKEASFTMRHEYGGRPVLVQGTIDCYFEQDGSWVLVDYKSNFIAKERLAAEEQRLRDEYLPQLELYRKALNSATGKPVKKAVLYLFGADKEISIDN